jgi:hypothetical protein
MEQQMRILKLISRPFLTFSLPAAATVPAQAVEYALSTYALGESAFSAGVTPPPGTYVTAVTAYYSSKIEAALRFGGVTLNAGAKLDFFGSDLNVLYVPDRKLLGGNLGLSVTIPAGYINIDASIGAGSLAASREVNGWGFGDVIPRVQLGWQHGDFAHTVYLEGIITTGFWEKGFAPIISFNRAGIDTGWAFTWTDKPTKLQVSGTAGFTFNFENDPVNYQSGDEFHWEWAVGFECLKGLVLGVVGYDYRQITGDSGSGAKLGAFEGSVDAIGPGLSYTTVIDKMPVTLNLRYYHEFDAQKHFEGDSTIASGTICF